MKNQHIAALAVLRSHPKEIGLKSKIMRERWKRRERGSRPPFCKNVDANSPRSFLVVLRVSEGLKEDRRFIF